jgi:hypothetical protein
MNFCFSDVKFYDFWFSHPWIPIRIRIETDLAQSSYQYVSPFFLYFTYGTYNFMSWILLGPYPLIHIGACTQFTYIMDGIKWFFEDY